MARTARVVNALGCRQARAVVRGPGRRAARAPRRKASQRLVIVALFRAPDDDHVLGRLTGSLPRMNKRHVRQRNHDTPASSSTDGYRCLRADDRCRTDESAGARRRRFDYATSTGGLGSRSGGGRDRPPAVDAGDRARARPVDGEICQGRLDSNLPSEFGARGRCRSAVTRVVGLPSARRATCELSFDWCVIRADGSAGAAA
jgi:hypothetical protein